MIRPDQAPKKRGKRRHCRGYLESIANDSLSEKRESQAARSGVAVFERDALIPSC